jgi:methylmalonyl-CoA mutase N-terminal domain/subunit
MADKAWAIIEEVEAMGGMTKAVGSGWPSSRSKRLLQKSKPALIPAKTSLSA